MHKIEVEGWVDEGKQTSRQALESQSVTTLTRASTFRELIAAGCSY